MKLNHGGGRYWLVEYFEKGCDGKARKDCEYYRQGWDEEDSPRDFDVAEKFEA
ncbi:MAG: hypothetical protein QXU87_06340 [Candidatus Caldarchaeum sp.]